MPQALAKSLADRVARALPELRALAPSGTPPPGAWSPKQELGHLIDSAANNHIRIVQAALNGAFTGPGYAQNEWVDLHGYAELEWNEVVDFWADYNALLVRVITRIPEAALSNPCTVGDHPAVPLGALIEDYVSHMAHHLERILQ